MTLYRCPHYGYRFFAGAHYDVLPYVVILNGDKKVLWEKRESGTVKRSEESMTLMTFYGFPHHGSRSFACVPDDALPMPSLRIQILRWHSGWSLARLQEAEKPWGKNGKRGSVTE